MDIHSTVLHATPAPVAELDRLGDEIAELSAHLEAPPRVSSPSSANSTPAAAGIAGSAPARLARLADRPRRRHRPREGSRGARPGHAAPARGGFARGELSYAKVLRSDARRHTGDRVAAARGGRGGTAAHVERIVQAWRWVDRKAEAREAARQHASRALHVHQDDDGTVVLRGRLEPEVGALFVKALAAARETLYQQHRNAHAVQ